MNERIKELAEQAQPDPIAFRVEHFQGDVGYWDKNEPVWKSGLYQKNSEHFTCKPLYTQDDLQKFAELIVRECCSISDEVERADTGMLASKYIKAYFGVEE